MTTTGIKNNNPLNIRLSDVHWEGSCDNQKDNSFVCFASPEWGIRAAYVILHTYNTKYHCKTLGQLISKWAPPTEKDTITYIRFMSRFCGVEPEHEVDINNEDFMVTLIRGMCKLENGTCPYNNEQIKKGIRLKDARYVA